MTVKEHVRVTLYFLPRDPLYDTEKPYSIQYTPHGDVPQTNVKSVPQNDVPVYNMRLLRDTLSLERDGFQIATMNSHMHYEDFANPARVEETYIPEIRDVLRSLTGSANIAILEYLVRRRHSSYPVSTGEDFEFAQPVASAHVDFSPACIEEIIADRYPDRVKQLQALRYQIVNVWKPLRGPLQDWPLALCRPTSVSTEHDVQLMDRVYPLNNEESVQFHYSEKQEWYYLKDQMPTELLIFRGGDSDIGISAGVPHCSFQTPERSIDSPPRESVEMRAIIFYSDQPLDLGHVATSRRHGPKSTYQQHES